MTQMNPRLNTLLGLPRMTQLYDYRILPSQDKRPPSIMMVTGFTDSGTPRISLDSPETLADKILREKPKAKAYALQKIYELQELKDSGTYITDSYTADVYAPLQAISKYEDALKDSIISQLSKNGFQGWPDLLKLLVKVIPNMTDTVGIANV